MINKISSTIDNSSWVYKYEGFKEEDFGDKIETYNFSGLSAQVKGDLNGNSYVKFECSNDGENWNDAVDVHGSLISIDEEGIAVLPVDYLYIKPSFVGVSESGVNVIIYGKGKK